MLVYLTWKWKTCSRCKFFFDFNLAFSFFLFFEFSVQLLIICHNNMKIKYSSGNNSYIGALANTQLIWRNNTLLISKLFIWELFLHLPHWWTFLFKWYRKIVIWWNTRDKNDWIENTFKIRHGECLIKNNIFHSSEWKIKDPSWKEQLWFCISCTKMLLNVSEINEQTLMSHIEGVARPIRFRRRQERCKWWSLCGGKAYIIHHWPA